MVTNSTGPTEVYSLGINNRLPMDRTEKLMKQLENGKEKTE